MRVVEQPKRKFYLVLAAFRRSPPQNRRKTGQLRRKTREDGQKKEGTDRTRFGGFKKKREVRNKMSMVVGEGSNEKKTMVKEGGGAAREREREREK